MVELMQVTIYYLDGAIAVVMSDVVVGIVLYRLYRVWYDWIGCKITVVQGQEKIIACQGKQMHSTVLRSTSQYETVQYSTVQYSTAAQYSSTVQYSTVQYSIAQHSTAQHSTAQHSTAQHSIA